MTAHCVPAPDDGRDGACAVALAERPFGALRRLGIKKPVAGESVVKGGHEIGGDAIGDEEA